jgi:hypothetical protein
MVHPACFTKYIIKLRKQGITAKAGKLRHNREQAGIFNITARSEMEKKGKIYGWRKFGIAALTVVGLLLAGAFKPDIPDSVVYAVAGFAAAYTGVQGVVDRIKDSTK